MPNKPDSDDILRVTRDLGCLQLDPISTVAPSHLIALWSRLGNFDTTDLDKLLWRDKKLFQYWAPAGSVVMMADYSRHYSLMRSNRSMLASLGSGWLRRIHSL